MIDPKDLTIVFTTYNELDCLKLAIYSFLEFYPQYKQSIKVFDDCSERAIADWLAEEGIERITWVSNTFVSNFASYMKIYPATSTSLRNSWMIAEILKNHIMTRYVMFNDNDLVFLKFGFMEHYEQLLQEGYKAVAQYEEYNYNWAFCKTLSPELIKNYLGKYYSLYDPVKKVMRRLHWCHGIMDHEYFKGLHIYFDSRLDRKFIWLVLQGSIAETGTDFFYQIEQIGAQYFMLDTVFDRMIVDARKSYFPLQDGEYDRYDIYHMRWMSSNSKIRDHLDGNHEIKQQSLNVGKKIAEDLKTSTKLAGRIQGLVDKYGITMENRFEEVRL